MRKNYMGTQILCYLCVLQMISTPPALRSPAVHHTTAILLLIYEAFLVYLIAWQAKRIQSLQKRGIAISPARPRYFTLTNLLSTVAIAGSSACAWITGFLPILVTTGAVAVAGSTLHLYISNRRHWAALASKNANPISSFA